MCRLVRCKSERVIAERRDPDHVGEKSFDGEQLLLAILTVCEPVILQT